MSITRINHKLYLKLLTAVVAAAVLATSVPASFGDSPLRGQSLLAPGTRFEGKGGAQAGLITEKAVIAALDLAVEGELALTDAVKVLEDFRPVSEREIAAVLLKSRFNPDAIDKSPHLYYKTIRTDKDLEALVRLKNLMARLVDYFARHEQDNEMLEAVSALGCHLQALYILKIAGRRADKQGARVEFCSSYIERPVRLVLLAWLFSPKERSCDDLKEAFGCTSPNVNTKDKLKAWIFRKVLAGEVRFYANPNETPDDLKRFVTIEVIEKPWRGLTISTFIGMFTLFASAAFTGLGVALGMVVVPDPTDGYTRSFTWEAARKEAVEALPVTHDIKENVLLFLEGHAPFAPLQNEAYFSERRVKLLLGRLRAQYKSWEAAGKNEQVGTYHDIGRILLADSLYKYLKEKNIVTHEVFLSLRNLISQPTASWHKAVKGLKNKGPLVNPVEEALAAVKRASCSDIIREIDGKETGLIGDMVQNAFAELQLALDDLSKPDHDMKGDTK